jgi:hypothetical protein
LLTPDLASHGPLAELLIDRGYLGSPDIGALHARGVAIRAKAWTSTNRGRFPKSAFAIHLAEAQVTCPAEQTAPTDPGATTVHFARLSPRTFWNFASEFSSRAARAQGRLRAGAEPIGRSCDPLSRVVPSRRTGPRIPMAGCR